MKTHLGIYYLATETFYSRAFLHFEITIAVRIELLHAHPVEKMDLMDSTEPSG